MKRKWMILSVLGYYACIIVSGLIYGFKSAVILVIASCCTAMATVQIYKDDADDEPEHDSCEGCKHNLGGGNCRINLEDECAAGGGYEAWESKHNPPKGSDAPDA